MSAPSVLDGLDDEQLAAVTAPRGPVLVRAGAGTGKTRVLTRRIAWAVREGHILGRHVLAVTFSVRAADELRVRLAGLGVDGVTARTFHAAALATVQQAWPRAVGGEPPRVADRRLGLLTAACPAQLRRDPAALRELATEIEWAKASLTAPEDYAAAAAAAQRRTAVPAADVAEAYAAYEDHKAAQGVMDFDDVLLLAAAVLEEHEDVATDLRRVLRWFAVDEYQDVSALQQRVLDAWLGGRDDVFVVGDPLQTVYTFAGATASYLESFPARYPNATCVDLVRDYRSTTQVVAAANALAGSEARLVAGGGDGPPVRLAEYADDGQEAEDVARRCADLVASGTDASRLAVLVRQNGQLTAFEPAFAAAGVRYTVRGAEPLFGRAQVRQAVRLLLELADPDAGAEAMRAAVEGVARGLGWPSSGGAAALGVLVAMAERVLARGTPAELLDRLRVACAPTDAAPDAVTLATLHAAKGLEWDAVFVAGVREGVLPAVQARTRSALDEERRLLYVGCTRARRLLQVSWARGEGRVASRFLATLADAAEPAGPALGHNRAP